MAEIVPVIFTKDFDDLKKKVEAVSPYIKTVQLDVADGIFVDNKTFWQPEDLAKMETKVFLEAHLMIDSPHRMLNRWLASPIGRVILHWEAMEKIHNHELLPYKTQIDQYFPVSNLAEEIRKNNKEFGIALNPETPVEVLDNFISKIDLVLLMSVHPGFSGQKFEADVIPKIKQLRQKHPSVKIEVDGGINLGNCRQLAQAGADLLVVGSGLFDSNDIIRQINLFKDLLK